MKKNTTKELLLQRAIDLFYESGYTKTPIRKITEKIDVKNTIIYYYFKSKDHLLYTIIESTADDIIDGLAEIVNRVSDPLQRVREMFLYHFAILERQRKQIKIFVEDNDKLPPKMRLKIKDKKRRIYQLYADQFQLLVNQGKTKDIEVPLITFSALGMINWTYRWFKAGGDLSVKDIAEKSLSILFSGILIDPEKSD